MQQKNLIIWWYTFRFLSAFHPLLYDSVPLAPLLLRDVQKYLLINYNRLSKPLLNEDLSAARIQAECFPYLIDSKPNKAREGYTLIRSNLYSLTEGINEQSFIYLAHHQKEYHYVKKQMMKSYLFYYLDNLPESRLPFSEEKRVYEIIDKVFSGQSLHPVFQTKQFQSWLRRKIALTLIRIRKINGLFHRYPIAQTIYGSTINRYGALVTSYAQTRKILTVNLQHGIFGELGHLPVNADKNLVWGKADLNYLLQFGVPEERLEIVGPYLFRNPAYLQALDEDKVSKENAGINVLVALQPLGYQYNKTMISKIEKAVERFSNKIAIKYKLHPDQKNVSIYQKCIIQPNSSLIPHGTVPIEKLIAGSSLIITPFSTVAYQALLYEKPVVFYGQHQELYYLEGDITYVYHLSDIKKVFAEMVKEPSYLLQLKKRIVLKDYNSICYDKQQLWAIIKNEGLKEE